MKKRYLTADDWRCKDCGSFNQSLMYKHDVWKSVADKDILLCTTCFEKRLGRETTIDDLLPGSGMNDATILMVQRVQAQLENLVDEIRHNGIELDFDM